MNSCFRSLLFLPLEGPSGHLWHTLWLISLHSSLKKFVWENVWQIYYVVRIFVTEVERCLFKVLQIQMWPVISYYLKKFCPWLYRTNERANISFIKSILQCLTVFLKRYSKSSILSTGFQTWWNSKIYYIKWQGFLADISVSCLIYDLEN